MATFKTFEDIAVWTMGQKMVQMVYALTRKGEFSKDFSLCDQIRRAAVSVPSNIAEGFERNGNREFVKFLYIAKGSAGEVRSQLHTARNLGYLSEQDFMASYDFVRRVSAGISNLIKVLSSLTPPTL